MNVNIEINMSIR